MNSSITKGEIDKHMESFISAIVDQGTDNTKLDGAISSLTESISKVKDIWSSKETIRKGFEAISAWILKNFSSSRLNSMINLVTAILNGLGYTVEIKRDGKENKI